ncbi:hypothetical protein H8N03_04725 [Ramlibacter sp. USB13]|uniref:Uncharacterized protein n=1 Tax=Ramlibacter cellulosilyticus TaxID=2764187 RepID=A0A923MMA7_9BURK|nr:hypothetical protein [Ramlibacter cellulosilyticus]MBC5782237.1 hypothetical protein [Ramlibacter cellulosilyticus]
MTDLYATLLSWAVTLSGYPAPAEPPVVVPKPHAFFVEQACSGQPCKVLGWYAGGRNLYIDEALDPEGNLLASSIVVHEMVHYLQGVARGDDVLRGGAAFSIAPSCEQAVQWEHEAYAVQREYILRYGAYLPVGSAMLHVHCDSKAAQR